MSLNQLQQPENAGVASEVFVSYLCWSRLGFGALSLLIGIALSLWAWRHWRQPSLLSPGSVMYRFLLAYSPWPRTREERSPDRLTEEEIKLHAARGLVVGIGLVILGIMSVTLPA